MPKTTFALRLHEARLVAGLSMDRLADLTDRAVSKQSISRYEQGAMHPKHPTLVNLARALNISEQYLLGNGISIDTPMLRASANSKLTEGALQRLEARLACLVERYLAKEDVADIHTPFSNPLQGQTVSTVDDISEAADLLRACWRCGDGPIPYILRLFERKGIKMFTASLPEGIDGLSTWANATIPIIVLDMRPEKTTPERIRFTACHELAHLLLSFAPDSDLSIEKRCHKFAGFFLIPRRTFIEEMGSTTREFLTLDELIDLKQTYGTSIAAQVHEAWDIHMITRQHYDWWYDERIKPNYKEIGWGAYPLPEDLGRERRIDSIVEQINIENK